MPTSSGNLVDNVSSGDAFNWNNLANNATVDLTGGSGNTLNASNSLFMRSNKGNAGDPNFFKQSSGNSVGGLKTVQ